MANNKKEPEAVRANDKLRMTRNLIADEYQNIQAGTHSVLNTSKNIHGAKDKYGQYTDKINRSKNLVDEIQKAEKWDEMKLRYSFNFLMGTSIYLLLKRFFLWEILYAIYYLAIVFGQYLIQFILMPILSSSSTGSDEKGFVLMDYLLYSTP